MEDSEVRDNPDGIGVRVTNGGTFFMNVGAYVQSNNVGVELTGNTAELVMTDAEIRNNIGAGVAVTNGNLFMNAGAHVRNNDVGVTSV